jgi:hypothetical protein
MKQSLPTYPIYVQQDAIKSLLNQLTEHCTSSRKISVSNGQSAIDLKKIGVVASLLQVLGIESSICHEVEENSTHVDEELVVLEPEHKVREIRRILIETGNLHNLNSRLMRKVPFGSFVDFQMEAKFKRVYRFVEISGAIGEYYIKSVCSVDYLSISRSYLFQIMRGELTQSLVGFGVIINVDQISKTIDIKPLILAVNKQKFQV